MPKIKKIAVLTSGGDSSGMNPAIRSVVRCALSNGIKVMGVTNGYRGLMEDQIFDMDASSVGGIINRGGTILYSARAPEFANPEGIAKAADNFRKHDLDALIVIGGDGTYRGALDFYTICDIPVIGIPGTIDNDINGTDYTIGYDTAVNVATEAIDKLRDTATSHGRCFVVEVMGRHAGYIALEVGIASGAEDILIPETPTKINDVIENLERGRKRGKKSSIIVVAEGDDIGGGARTCEMIEGKTGYSTRLTILGHMQRGGSPTAYERLMASRFGYIAIKALLEGKYNIGVGSQKGAYTFTDINEAVRKKREIKYDDLEMCKQLSL